jgi:hypothetical protein
MRGEEMMYIMMMTYGMAFLFVVPVLLIALAIPYAVLRMRDGREGPPDPQLGFKVAMHFFFSVSIILFLVGLTIIVVGILVQSGRPFGDAMPGDSERVGVGMIISGILFALVHFICILTLTTQPFTSPVRRTFVGARFGVHGLVVMMAATGLLISLFMRHSTGEERRALVGVLVVWSPSWLLHLVLLRLRLSWGGRDSMWPPEQEGPEAAESPRHEQEREWGR